ncbi:MAG: hypothetical protein HDR52_00045 [Treponema sp.]|nr:hypothetical protein [Treponema sp.]
MDESIVETQFLSPNFAIMKFYFTYIMAKNRGLAFVFIWRIVYSSLNENFCIFLICDDFNDNLYTVSRETYMN